MPEPLLAGPYRTVTLDDGSQLPWYIVPFDKGGRCTGPLTRDHLVNEVRQNAYSDVFLFSHGWNNDWQAASQRYDGFLNGYLSMMRTHGFKYPTAHHSVLVGIFWPSTALVMPWERGPDFAADAGTLDAEVAETRRDIDELAADVHEDNRDEYYRLVQRDKLSETEGRRLAEILSRAFAGYAAADADLVGGKTERSAEDLLDAWSQIPVQRAAVPPTGDFGFAGGGATASAAPEGAFSLSDLDPRHIVRTATVLQMKDRAGTVGARGVGPLLRDLISPSVRVHMVGHSYGSIVMLSALCYPPNESAPPAVESLLLLQPAVSQWCFAENVAGQGYPGGYRRALKQVKKPIFTTFTRNDVPLTKLFHLAARRARDLGQPQIAAAGLPQPPSRYAALGGFGPAGLSAQELQIVAMTNPPDRYQLRTPPGAPKICALNGDTRINGHGDVSTAAAWWALFQQVDDS